MDQHPPLDIIVLAGGRIDGKYATAAGTNIKAMVPVHGEPVLTRLVNELTALALGPVTVVGPSDVAAICGPSVRFVPEAGGALANVIAALDVCGEASGRTLICASDTPFVTADAIRDFLSRVPDDAELAVPVVSEKDFNAAYPSSPGTYVRLVLGGVTIGSQIVADKAALRRNVALFEDVFSRRKSQFAMAQKLGLGFIAKLVTGRLALTDIERKVGELTNSKVSAVMGSLPQLAFDIDTLDEWLDANSRMT